MEILIVAGVDPETPNTGGIDVYVMNLLKQLQKHGIDVTLIGISHKSKLQLLPEYTINFISIVHKSEISGWDYLISLLLKIPFLKILNSSIIHTQRPDDMLQFILFHNKNPKICTLHGKALKGIDLKQPKIVAKVYGFVESFCLKHIDKLIAVDETTKQFYEQLYPWLKNKITVIPIGIDLNKFKPMNKEEIREKYGFDTKDKIITYVGRLEKEKNLDFLIKSFVLVKEHDSHTKLVFVGDGREGAYLKNLVDVLELKDVIFMGAQELDKIPEILNCADVLVLCSLFEGCPTVVREALACGIPVVSTDVGDVGRIIRNEATGRIVSRDKKEFAQAIVEMLLNEDKKRVRIECAKVAANFSFNQVGMRTVELYKELLVEKGFELGRRPGRTRVD